MQLRIDEQIVDAVSFPQVVEQLGEVPKFSCHDEACSEQSNRSPMYLCRRWGVEDWEGAVGGGAKDFASRQKPAAECQTDP